MATTGFDFIISHARRLSENNIDASSTKHILQQILPGIEEQRQGINGIIELILHLQEQGHQMSIDQARGIVQQINLAVNNQARFGGRVHRQLERKKTYSVKSICRETFNAFCDDVCAICLETHIVGDSVETECRHMFGKDCWKNWIASSNANNHTCPSCRKADPTIISFKVMRRTEKRR